MEWSDFIADEVGQDYFEKLSSFLLMEEKLFNICPPKEDIFKAFDLSSFKNTRCLILAQDPYFNPNQAHGLAFSILDGFQLPPSLLNIYKEIKSDLDIPIPKTGNLTPWAKQGVLLLNSILTVRQGQSLSHKNQGWEIFTDKVIKLLNDTKENMVFMLWGGFAKSKASLITNKSHLILQTSHPSPLASHNGFFGSHHFSKANDFLKSKGLEPINWDLSKQ